MKSLAIRTKAVQIASMLTQQIVDYWQDPISVVVGTRDANLIPGFIRVFGIFGRPGGTSATFVAPEATSAEMLRNLKDNAQVAVQVVHIPDFESYQLKGKYVLHRPATLEENALVEQSKVKTSLFFANAFGLPPDFWTNYISVPAISVEFNIEAIFIQTPGPNAGQKIS